MVCKMKPRQVFLPVHKADGNPEGLSPQIRTASTKSEIMGQDQDNTQTDAAPAEGGQGAAAARSALVRKAHVGREEHQARAMTLAKALRLTTAKVADDLFDMALAVIGLRAEQRAGDALAPLFEGAGLLMLLEGPERRRAAAVMDAALVGALIQQQTMGKVMPLPEGAEDRKLTDTDAAICAPFLDALLSRVAPLPEVPSDQSLMDGYTFGVRTEEPRLLLMALEAPAYRVLHLTLDIEGGRRQGQLMLCMPEAGVGVSDVHRAAGQVQGAAPIDPQPPRNLTEPVLALQIDLPVALTRFRLPLSKLSSLKVGDALALEEADFSAARVMTPQGKTLGRGMLGQVSGMRALRLMSEAGGNATTADFGAVMGAEGGHSAELPSLDLGGSDVAGMDGLPDLPDLTGTGAMDHEAESTELPDLPDLPDMSDLPDLPDMSDLPELDDFDPLPDMPELADLKVG